MKRDARLFVIATEGQETEKRYFEIFRLKRCQVKILPSNDGKSSPEHVLKALDGYKEEFQIGEGDELWYMSDVDRWRDAKLAAITQQCFQKGYFTAISNPCFELWLYLHHADVDFKPAGCREITRQLRRTLQGYKKTNIPAATYLSLVDAAIIRAENLDINQGTRWPAHPGTHVYKVVRKIKGLG